MTRKKSSSVHSAKGPSQRMLRIGELVRHKIAEMLVRGDIHDDVIASHSITIPEVRISPDMKMATVYVMPLGGKSMKPVIEALTRNKKYKTFEEATRIDRLLDSPHVRQDVDKK
jgi:ribosome-binding factor A